MPNPKKLVASAAIAAGLLGGGVVGVVFGVPGVSGAQTTTVPDSPGTPAPGATPHDGKDCPLKDGAGATAPDGSGTPGTSGTNLGFHRGGGGRI